MKKILFATILCAAICITTAQAQTSVSALFDEFSQSKGSESMNVNPFMFRLYKLFMKEGGETAVSKKITSVHILSMDACSDDVKKDFCNKAHALNDSLYETYATSKDTSDEIQVLVKKHKDAIKEVTILVISEDEPSIMAFKGSITEDDIKTLIKQYRSQQ